LSLQPIGVIRTPFKTASGTPIQPAYAQGAEGEVVVDDAFAPALVDIEGFERVWLIYWLHRAGPYKPLVVPYRDTREHGVFATRSPCRPNPIGLSVVRVVSRDGGRLKIEGIDILDGTTLLDIKPYIPEFDAYSSSRAGWFDERREDRRVADDRFHPRPSRER